MAMIVMTKMMMAIMINSWESVQSMGPPHTHPINDDIDNYDNIDTNDCYGDNDDYDDKDDGVRNGNNDELMGVCPGPYLLLISTFSQTTTMIFAQNDYSQC